MKSESKDWVSSVPKLQDPVRTCETFTTTEINLTVSGFELTIIKYTGSDKALGKNLEWIGNNMGW
ncbi:unnamed protein product [Ranitomeya imitator]|uniref:Uncharacterized protein n=1 Tax=Ranitomeya imitator TaxID=111125 RepID=A0ABN9M034_9NEOB|nr:unnamed protein product [Ranitomeya imitator]